MQHLLLRSGRVVAAGPLEHVMTEDIVSATFGMRMQLGGPYEMTNTVVEFEENRRIAWQPRPANAIASKLVGGQPRSRRTCPLSGILLDGSANAASACCNRTGACSHAT